MGREPSSVLWNGETSAVANRSGPEGAGCAGEETGPGLATRTRTSTGRGTLMGGTGVIDSFLSFFTSNIDSGFGLLNGEVAFLATTLAAIDITLAAIFWSWA